MAIKQLSVFVENKEGKLREITDILAKAGIDIRALSIADTSEFGILRLIVRDPQKAKALLEKNGFVATINDVVGVEINDSTRRSCRDSQAVCRKRYKYGIHVRFSHPHRKQGLSCCQS